jgi:hypothetical protein
MTKTIRLNDDQMRTLEQLLAREFEQEWLYQIDGDKETWLLWEYYSLYEAIMGKPKNAIEGFATFDVLRTLKNKIAEVTAQ